MNVAIHVSKLTKVFADRVRAVDGVDLSILHGEIFGLLGPNGAGKTTAVRMMTGLLQATSGTILVEGRELSPARMADAAAAPGAPNGTAVSPQGQTTPPVTALQSDIRTRIGVCPQENAIWDDLTVSENIRFIGRLFAIPGKKIGERADRLMSDLNLTDKKDTLVRHLSGGMKRRLNLMLALVHEPAILFLDEPSTGLDPQTRLLLWDFIKGMSAREKKTVLLTTHYMEEADRLCDRLAIMDKGRVLVLDTPDALKQQHGGGDQVTMKVGSAVSGSAGILAGSGPEAVRQKLCAIPGLTAVEWHDGSLRFVLSGTVAENASTLQRALETASSCGVQVDDLHVHRSTLEDVFIRLTGKRLRDEDGG